MNIKNLASRLTLYAAGVLAVSEMAMTFGPGAKSAKNINDTTNNPQDVPELVSKDASNGLKSLVSPQITNTFNVNNSNKYDIVVVGDELESVIAAISSAKTNNQKVALISPAHEGEPLGGLITRSGQTSLDRDFTNYKNGKKLVGEYERILALAGVKPNSVDIDPILLNKVLENELKINNVTVIRSVDNINPIIEKNKIKALTLFKGNDSVNISAKVVIDTSPEGIIFEKTQAPRLGNLKDLSSSETNPDMCELLAVSPIPNIKGITFKDLDILDKQIRKEGVSFQDIKQNSTNLEFEPLAPDEEAQLKNSGSSKVVNRAIGTDFVHFMWQKYPTLAAKLKLNNKEDSLTSVQGFNLSQIKDGSINFNGLLFRAESPEEAKEMIQKQKAPTEEMKMLSEKFSEYLSLKTGKKVSLKLPKELYVRDAGMQYATTNTTTLKDLVESKVTDKTVATFSYANDTRGCSNPVLSNTLNDKNSNIIKPEVQIEADEGQSPNIDNLVGTSQSIGSTPGAKGVSRIEHLLSIEAELLGTRASLAAKNTDGNTKLISDDLLVKIMRSRGYYPRPSKPVEVTAKTHISVNDQLAIINKDAALIKK